MITKEEIDRAFENPIKPTDMKEEFMRIAERLSKTIVANTLLMVIERKPTPAASDIREFIKQYKPNDLPNVYIVDYIPILGRRISSENLDMARFAKHIDDIRKNNLLKDNGQNKL